MPFPRDVPVVDLMMGIPVIESNGEWYAPFAPLLMDAESRQALITPTRAALRCDCSESDERELRMLQSKTIFITDAASGIGRATAAACREAGARVAAADLSPAAEIEAALGAGPDLLALTLDVSDEPAVRVAVAAALRRFGSMQGLVNCAGINAQGVAHTLDLAFWQCALGVHLTGSFLLAKHVLPSMLTAKAGAIVFLLSDAASFISGANLPVDGGFSGTQLVMP